MAVAIENVLGILREHGIEPEEQSGEIDIPGIGTVEEGETIYTTSIAEVFNESDEPDSVDEGDERLGDFIQEIRRISEAQTGAIWRGPTEGNGVSDPPEPHCAWYCPIHFFGHGWGIFLREICILQYALEVARFVDWHAFPRPLPLTIPKQLLRSAFYVLYLHEQFHHKVESLGFRLLIATGTDRYRPYKTNVYRRLFLTPDCLEESLANADSYRRLNEERYVKKLDKPIRDGLRDFLKVSFRMQPPGYAEALHFLSPRYRVGLHQLQSQLLDGRYPAVKPAHHWSVAPNVITSLMDISDDIYVILPAGRRPIFRATSVDPGFTVSSRGLISLLTSQFGYQIATGGKGSHVKLVKPGAPNIHIPGNRAVLSPGVVKQALNAIGGYPLSALPNLLNGNSGRVPA